MRRRVLIQSAASAVLGVLLAASSASAQTVTVDPANPTPDNVSTFSSLMLAINSFQASGATTAASPGGVGVNHGNVAPDVINITSTTMIDEVVRIDERPASGGYSILDEALAINGPGAVANSGVAVAPSASANAIVASRDDGANDDDNFEIRTNVNLTINNVTFVPSPTAPGAPAGNNDIVTVDRLTASAGSPSTVSFNSCIITSLNLGGTPLVNSKTDALADLTSSIVATTTQLDDLMDFFPDAGEGMTCNLTDCVLAGTPLGTGRDGIVEASGYTATDGIHLNITSSVLSNCGRFAIQWGGTAASGGAVATEKTLTIGGTAANAGPVAGLGGPTVMTRCGDRAIQSFLTSAGRSRVTIDNAIIADNTIRQISLSGSDELVMSNSLVSGPTPLVYQSSVAGDLISSITNSTINGATSLLGAQGTLTSTLTISDSILTTSGATTMAVFGTGDANAALSFTGYFAVAVGGSTNTTSGTGVFRASPAFVSTDPLSADFLDVRNTAYATANSTSGPLAGGANYVGGVAPASITLTAPPSINFGTVSTSSAVNDTTSVSVANSGGADGIVGFARTGANPAEFTSSPTSVGIVPPAGLPVTVTFAPTLVQASTASLDITGDAVQSVALSGTGQVSDVHDWMAY
jgi:hypothetical protein